MMKPPKLFVTKAAEDCRQAEPAPNEHVSKSRERRGVRQSPAAFPERSECGLTLLEVLIVILVFVILLGLVWPFGETSGKQKAIRIQCLSNLKQIGVAFPAWIRDGDHYPMEVYTDTSGAPLYTTSADMFRYFQVLSNELSNPKVLICPDDKGRRAATNFTTDFNSSHISYFLGLDADDTRPNYFLAGDANITNGFAAKNGLLELTTNQNVAWTMERHGGAGNVVFADERVQQLSTVELQKALQKTGLATNLLLMPDKNSVK